MKKVNLLLLVLFTLCFLNTSLQAAQFGSRCDCMTSECCPVYDCGNTCSIGVGAEFLYWKPCPTHLDFAATIEGQEPFISVGPYNSKIKSVCTDWEPGVRVTLGSAPTGCNWGWRASYTYISPCASSSLSGDAVAILTMHPFANFTEIKVKAKWDACYHEFDLLFSSELSCNPCFNIVATGGLVGMYQEQKLFTFPENFDFNPYQYPCTYLVGPEFSSRWKSDYWGLGVRIGSEFTYQFSDCFGFYVNGKGSLIAGKATSKVKEIYCEGTSWEIKNSDCGMCVQGFDVGAGFIFETDGCGCDLTFKVGYELLKWYNLPNIRMFSDAPLYGGSNGGLLNGTSADDGSLGFHGLVVGLAIGF